MSVLSPRRTDEKKPIHGRADRGDPARMGCGGQGRGPGAASQRDRANAVSLEEEIRRPPDQRGQAVAGARGRESATEATRRRSSAESASGEGSPGKKVVTPEHRRTAVTVAMSSDEPQERP